MLERGGWRRGSIGGPIALTTAIAQAESSGTAIDAPVLKGLAKQSEAM